ncbi:uncharacterized protein LOC143146054 [Ptiloglossa arizonensis]|uniref:uncharacterized protein LOC143146054 n=1 Tax=Ptiloglossa arizonensis TaxID=3350558 RepID=UPI003FA16C37
MLRFQPLSRMIGHFARASRQKYIYISTVSPEFLFIGTRQLNMITFAGDIAFVEVDGKVFSSLQTKFVQISKNTVSYKVLGNSWYHDVLSNCHVKYDGVARSFRFYILSRLHRRNTAENLATVVTNRKAVFTKRSDCMHASTCIQ